MRTLLARLFVFLLAILTAAAAAADPALVTVSGKVEVGRGTPPAWRPARSGDVVAFGDAVRTGENARAELALGDGRVVRIYERSLLRIGTETTPTGAARSVSLDEGKSLFDVMRRAIGDEFEVRTPEIIVSVKGTRFLVGAVPGPDFTSVFRGSVSLGGGGLDDVLVRAGFTGAEGELLVHSFDDPWHGWEAGAEAPEPAVEQLRDEEVREAIESARDEGAAGASAEKAEERKDRLADAKDEVGEIVAQLDALDPIEDVGRRGRGGNDDDDDDNSGSGGGGDDDDDSDNSGSGSDDDDDSGSGGGDDDDDD